MGNPITPPSGGGDAIDLTTLAAVKKRAEVVGSADDQDIQDAITAFSQFVVTYTGIKSFNGQVTMSELRDGSGTDTMFARTPPIDDSDPSKVQVIVSGYSVPYAGAGTGAGWFTSDDKRAFRLRGVLGGFSRLPYDGLGYRSNLLARCGFPRGQGNVQLIYPGGYASCPADLEIAVRHIVSINYKRKAWQDIESKGITGGGTSATTRFRDWAWPPEDQEILEYYQRKAAIW